MSSARWSGGRLKSQVWIRAPFFIPEKPGMMGLCQRMEEERVLEGDGEGDPMPGPDEALLSLWRRRCRKSPSPRDSQHFKGNVADLLASE